MMLNLSSVRLIKLLLLYSLFKPYAFIMFSLHIGHVFKYININRKKKKKKYFKRMRYKKKNLLSFRPAKCQSRICESSVFFYWIIE